MSDERRAKIIEVVARVAERPAAEIKPEHDLRADLELDSYQALDLLSELEETFELDIPEVEAAKLATVGDILAYAERHA